MFRYTGVAIYFLLDLLVVLLFPFFGKRKRLWYWYLDPGPDCLEESRIQYGGLILTLRP